MKPDQLQDSKPKSEEDAVERASVPLPTLGQRLAQQAQVMMAGRLPSFPWLDSLQPVLARVASLPTPDANRFRRIERTTGSVRLPAARVRRLNDESPWQPDSSEASVVGAPADGRAVAPADTFSRRTGAPTRISRPSVPPGAIRPLSPRAYGLSDMRQSDSFEASIADAPPESRTSTLVEAAWQPNAAPSHSSRPGAPPDAVRTRDAAHGASLPTAAQSRLREALGPGVEAMRVHTDAAADGLARSLSADAVTMNRDVYVRGGQFRPDGPRGLALLAHEATHVVRAMQPNADWLRATGSGRAAEEGEALAIEQTLLRPSAPAQRGAQPAMPGYPAAAPAGLRPPAPGSTPPAAPPSAPAQQTMTAATNRDLEPRGQAAAPGLNFEELRQALYRDLLRQIRIDSERGA